MALITNLLKDIFASSGSADFDGNFRGLVSEDIARLEQSGDRKSAILACKKILGETPEHHDAKQLLADLEHREILQAVDDALPGPHYLEWLKWFHANIQPQTYLEIGVESGRSLQYAVPPTRGVGVDPELRVVFSQQAWVKLFAEKSDDFFANYEIANVFGSDCIDLAFIDGLHTFDQALRDFINIERNSRRESVVLFHDILPVVAETASRERNTFFWLGDTWKALLMISRFRPDLQMFTIPTSPSGLGVVTGLNPASDVLKNNLDLIIVEAMQMDLGDFLPDIRRHLQVSENDPLDVTRRLSLVRPHF